MFTQRQLFGGTITCDIPSEWRDVSDIRQVPDHQECFQEIDGAALVIEILDQQEVPDADAASFFFDDLAESNGSSENQFQNTALPTNANPINCVACAGSGIQKVAIGRDQGIACNPRQQDIRWVHIEICAFRLANVSTDLLLTVSRPVNSPRNASTQASSTFQKAVSTLQIQDWGLFG
jgi:hypothetical protein